MIEFEAHATAYAYGFLVHIEKVSEKATVHERDGRLLPADIAEVIKALDGIEEQLRLLKLTLAIFQIERIRIEVAGSPTIAYCDLACHARELRLRIHDELKQHLYLFVPATESEFYSSPRLFGDLVADNFHSASFDINEAGKCLALGRATACVFHLMRVMEVALRALANNLPGDHRVANWNKTLNDFDKVLDAMKETIKLNSAQKPLGWEDKEKFYSAASALLRNVKNAWRNSVMHIENKYTPEEAREIFQTTKSAMQFLASQLKE